MKYRILSAILSVSFICSASAQTLASFGSSESNLFTIDDGSTINLTVTQLAGSISFSGPENLGNQWAGIWSTPWTLTEDNKQNLAITISNNTTLTGNFTVQLFNTDFTETITFESFWADVSNTPAFLDLSYVSETSTFDQIGGFLIAIGGTSGNAIDASIINISVSPIPEPASFAAFAGAAILGLAAVRRRKRAA